MAAQVRRLHALHKYMEPCKISIRCDAYTCTSLHAALPMNCSSSISGPSQPVFIGSAISFMCDASDCHNGSTINSYQWVKDGAILTDGGRVSGTTQSTLSVSSVTLQDQGMYQCSAVNVDGISGELSNSAQITVYGMVYHRSS